MDAPTIIYDSTCAFCSGSIAWVSKRDPQHFFHYASSKSVMATDWMRTRGINPELADNTVILVLPKEGWYVRSEALHMICKKLQPRPWWSFVFHIFPYPFLNLGYRAVAYFRSSIRLSNR